MKKQNFTPLVRVKMTGDQYIQVNERVFVSKEIYQREIEYSINVLGNAVYLKPETAKRVVISLLHLLENTELDVKLDKKLQSKIIQLTPEYS